LDGEVSQAGWTDPGLSGPSNGVMLCTRCHHDIHRQGWDILVRAGTVEFVPPPQIDPMRRARPGGLAALDVGEPDRTPHAPWEDSAWNGYPPPDYPWDGSADHDEVSSNASLAA